MTITENLLNRFGYVSPKQLQDAIGETLKRELDRIQEEAVKKELAEVKRWQSETANAQRYTQPAPEIFANQADLYRLSPALGTAIDVLAGDVGTSKFNVKRLRDEEEIDIPNHEFEMRLRDPNPMDSGMELMQYTVSNYKLNGNSIWWLNRADRFSKVDEIWPIPYSMVRPIPDGRLYLSHYEYYPGNAAQPLHFETWEIVHFKTYNPNNRFYGISSLESLIETIQGDLYMRHSNTSDYQNNNGAPASILAFKEFVPNEQWNDVKAEIKTAAKRNEMMTLRGTGDGVSWLSRAMSKKDQEYIANLKQNMTDIFNRMCPGLLAMLSETATEANALAARATYGEKTLWVTEEVIAQKITSAILPAYGIKLRGHFDDPRVVDRKLQLEEQKEFSRSHTLAEVRKEKYQDDPLGDERDDELLPVAEKMQIKEAPPPSNVIDGQIVPPKQLPVPQDTQPAEEMALQDTGAADVSAKAVIEDLKRWRRMAIQGIEKDTKAIKAMSYISGLIPASVMRTIKIKLETLTSKDEIAKMFDAHIEDMKPKPHSLQEFSALKLLASSIDRAVTVAQSSNNERTEFYEAMKYIGDRQPQNNIYMPTPVINLPPSENNVHVSMPPQEAPNNFYTITPNITAPAVQVDSPINIRQTIEPAETPITNVRIENNFPEQPMPITNLNIENKMPEMQVPTVKNEIIIPDAPTPNITLSPIVQPSEVIVQITNEVQPTPIENKVTLNTPELDESTDEIIRDENDNITEKKTKYKYKGK